MEESDGEVKHVVLLKFKEGVSEQQIDEYIKQFANLVNLIPSIKSFKWGKELRVGKMQQDFSHVFELRFESAEDVGDYNDHPAHVEYVNTLLPQLEKVVVVDFNPTN